MMRNVKKGDISGVISTQVYTLNEVATMFDSDPRSIKKILTDKTENGMNFFKVGEKYKFLGEHIQSYVGTASHYPQPEQSQHNQSTVGNLQ